MICDCCKFVFTLDEARGDVRDAKMLVERGKPGYTTSVICPRCDCHNLVGRVDYRMPGIGEMAVAVRRYEDFLKTRRRGPAPITRDTVIGPNWDAVYEPPANAVLKDGVFVQKTKSVAQVLAERIEAEIYAPLSLIQDHTDEEIDPHFAELKRRDERGELP